MIRRTEYIEKLYSWKDEQVIKVITGIRRCGKSTLLAQYRDRLLAEGVEPERIISVNFEDLAYEEFLDYRKLHTYLAERIVPGKMTYIFLDEIQRVASYEKVVDSLYIREGVDLYITGSNSYMLSGDLATLLSGRYVEIGMLPFSFREFHESSGGDPDRAFADYLRIGGLPYAVTMARDGEKLDAYLEGIYNTVIVKDIEERQARKERDPGKRKVTDITLLKAIAKFLAGSLGSPISVKSVTDYLISNGRRVSPNTVGDYLEALSESFVFYGAERFDIVGKELLKTNQKMYMVDLGLRNHILPKRTYDLGFSVENVVYFELLRRGFRVHVGKLGDAEVDFVARRGEELYYYQVTADLTNEQTFHREMRPLRTIRDHYEKTVLTLDRFSVGSYDGIRVLNVTDWLLGK